MRAIVEVDVRAVCPRCAAGKGCGAGIFNGTEKRRSVQAQVSDNMILHKGDSVELQLAPASVLAAAGTVYGLPLLGALLAAAAAWFLRLGDAAAAAAAVLGLAGGFMLGRWKLQRRECIGDLMPTVGKKLHNAGN